jgi:hypothetical protein
MGPWMYEDLHECRLGNVDVQVEYVGLKRHVTCISESVNPTVKP